jgi:DNA-binding MarR family transcriptional regulator
MVVSLLGELNGFVRRNRGWIRALAACREVIEGQFESAEGAKPIGSSHGDSSIRNPSVLRPQNCTGKTWQFILASCAFLVYHGIVVRRNLESSVFDFTQAIGLLVRRLRVAVASHELSLTESVVMARLARDGPATTADLARAEGMRPQSMGTTIAALEAMGIVERKPHPTDGRQVIIALTAKGADVRKVTGDERRTWLAQAIAQLSKKEQETLFAAGELIKRLVEM